MKTITLYRPVGPEELDLVKQSGFTFWPPRLPEQPIFYPVLTEEYAIRIARDWNVKDSGCGFVTRFEVEADYLSQYEIQEAGGKSCQEYWIPAEDLNTFNQHIVGKIEIVQTYFAEDTQKAGQ